MQKTPGRQKVSRKRVLMSGTAKMSLNNKGLLTEREVCTVKCRIEVF